MIQRRLFTALYFLVFLFDRWTRGGNRERTGRQRKTEDLTGSRSLRSLFSFKSANKEAVNSQVWLTEVSYTFDRSSPGSQMVDSQVTSCKSVQRKMIWLRPDSWQPTKCQSLQVMLLYSVARRAVVSVWLNTIQGKLDLFEKRVIEK